MALLCTRALTRLGASSEEAASLRPTTRTANEHVSFTPSPPPAPPPPAPPPPPPPPPAAPPAPFVAAAAAAAAVAGVGPSGRFDRPIKAFTTSRSSPALKKKGEERRAGFAPTGAEGMITPLSPPATPETPGLSLGSMTLSLSVRLVLLVVGLALLQLTL